MKCIRVRYAFLMRISPQYDLVKNLTLCMCVHVLAFQKVTDKGDSCHLLRKDRAIVQIPLSEKHHFLGTLLGKALIILLVAFEKQRWINFVQISWLFLS